MQMPGRKYSVANTDYRYGFNGKENDNEVKGEGNQQDYGMRIYDPRLGRFLSVDPLTKTYPWYTPYQFAGNTPMQAIDLDGGEPESVVKTTITSSTYTDRGTLFEPIDPPKTFITYTNSYKLTGSATDLLSLMSGISESDIQKVNIQNAAGTLMPAYKPKYGGGAMTYPGANSNSYNMNFTDNYFSHVGDEPNYGKKDYRTDVMEWLDLTSHEVGHIKDIKEIGGGRAKYFATFIAGYAKAGGHNANWRETRADVGQTQFRSFVSFVDLYYGKDKLKNLFENKNNTEKDINGRVDQWFNQYQKQQEAEKKATSNDKSIGK